ncbi:MAG TPA: RdgB/HAM1 family non-canonical purine NTP pyrophosphatase [Trueperaceae bacterium]|nr:RdgB/HAM1 family non-canonical purine NTP pyrophosphatase [Trueperaceae bacterium]
MSRLRIVIATGNEGKLEEFRRGLGRLDVQLLSAREAGITRFPAESGVSYEENALLKAGYAALYTGLPALADDSGLEVDVLDGAPGVYSARFGGDVADGERIALLLDKLREVPRGARGASFVCSVVLATPGGEVKAFTGECRGEILEGPRGEGGFGYDPVFFSPELSKTFAEADADAKGRVSHRGRALQRFLEWALTPVGKRTMQETAPRRDANL